MKHFLCMLICFVLILSGFAVTAEGKAGSLSMTLDGTDYTLDFDSDSLYSYFKRDVVAASFYAYDTQDILYEVFLILPLSAQAGSVYSSAGGIDPGISEVGLMYARTDAALNAESGIATCVQGSLYPTEASFTITLNDVVTDGQTWSMSGHVDCVLAMVDAAYQTIGTKPLTADFRFTLTQSSENTLPESSADPFDTPSAEATPAPYDMPDPYTVPEPTPGLPDYGFGLLPSRTDVTIYQI